MSNANANATLATQTPQQIDTLLAEIYDDSHGLERTIESALRGIHAAAGDRRSLYSTTHPYTLSHEDAIAKVEARGFVWEIQTVTSLRTAEAKLEAVRNAAARLDKEFARRGGWSRFFIVQNAGGHIHRTMHCKSCRMTTRFGWLPDLSGQTEADAVAAHGALLCSICFPSAPVEWTNKWELEAAARKADKCAGSGKYYNSDLKHRTGFAHGNWATCEVCGDHVTLTTAYKLRAHKPKAAGS